jgi:V8-like Glu-specific endopeptidase
MPQVRVIGWILGVVLLTAGASASAASGDDADARTVISIRTVGPLFPLTSTAPHFCSASVLHSSTRDVVITAAHCVYGTGTGIVFAPGYHDGVTPYGSWSVTTAYVDPHWTAAHDPRYDFAVLRVAPEDGRRVEDVTGAPVLGSPPTAGRRVTVDGYVAGNGGRPITCANRAYYTDVFPSFDCTGYAGGVSGGPWLAGDRLVGVTGGLHQGGCSSDTSYSAPFGPAVGALLQRAESGAPGDVVVPAADDGC